MPNTDNANNATGWLHYYAAYLVTRCHVSVADVRDAIVRSAEEARRLWESGAPGRDAMTDNMLVMASNGWFYQREPYSDYGFTLDGAVIRLDSAALKRWMAALTE